MKKPGYLASMKLGVQLKSTIGSFRATAASSSAHKVAAWPTGTSS